jgi:4'-phosphopantetheinyl transferase EntD
MTSSELVQLSLEPHIPSVGFSLCEHPSQRRLRRAAQSVCGRQLARNILAQLNAPQTSVGKGLKGEPLWPENFFGSFSHSAADEKHSYVLVLISQGYGIAGVDIECAHPEERFQKVARSVFDETEHNLLEKQLGALGLAVGFSAKESIFKALYPLTKKWFWFPEAKILSLSETFLEIEVSELARGGVFTSSVFRVFWERLNFPNYAPAVITWVFYPNIGTDELQRNSLIHHDPYSLGITT